MAAAWFAPRPVAITALASTATGLVSAARWEYPAGLIMGIVPAGLLVVLTILMSGRQRPPRSWLWLAVAISAANVLDVITFIGPLRRVHYLIDVPLHFAPWVILGTVALWAVVDARPAIAMAVWITSSYLYLPDVGLQMSPYVIWTLLWYVPAAGSAVLAAAAIWRLRRQAAL